MASVDERKSELFGKAALSSAAKAIVRAGAIKALRAIAVLSLILTACTSMLTTEATHGVEPVVAEFTSIPTETEEPTPPSTKSPEMTPTTTPSLKIVTSENASEMQLITTLGPPIAGVAWAPSGEQLVTIDADGFKVRTVPSLQLVEDYRYEQRNLRCVAWSPDGYWIAGGTSDGLVLVWDVESGELEWTKESHGGEGVNDVDWSPDSQFIATGGDDNRVHVWDVATGINIIELKYLSREVNSVDWSPNGKMLAAAGNAERGDFPSVKVWETSSWYLQKTLSGVGGIVYWSPGGRKLGIVGDLITIWEFQEDITYTLKLIGGQDISWSPDGDLLAFLYMGGIQLWDVEDQIILSEVEGNNKWADRIAWSPKGDAVIELKNDGYLSLFGVPESGISVTTPKLGVGSKLVSDVDGMVMIFVPEGPFFMGAAEDESEAREYEKPQHEVYLDAFWIDRTEITNAMYANCVKVGICTLPSHTWFPRDTLSRPDYYDENAFSNFPVIWVNWEQARDYCDWTGRRLPTEAEWEKAARGTDGRRYPWGNEPPSCLLANYGNCRNFPSEVGTHPEGASPYGALDMAGNVWEWAADWFKDTYYEQSPSNNPLGPSVGTDRVYRGGGCKHIWLESTYRASSVPNGDTNNLGFRCALDAAP